MHNKRTVNQIDDNDYSSKSDLDAEASATQDVGIETTARGIFLLTNYMRVTRRSGRKIIWANVSVATSLQNLAQCSILTFIL